MTNTFWCILVSLSRFQDQRVMCFLACSKSSDGFTFSYVFWLLTIYNISTIQNYENQSFLMPRLLPTLSPSKKMLELKGTHVFMIIRFKTPRMIRICIIRYNRTLFFTVKRDQFKCHMQDKHQQRWKGFRMNKHDFTKAEAWSRKHVHRKERSMFPQKGMEACSPLVSSHNSQHLNFGRLACRKKV